ncbi:hypothetical protein IW140_004387 [Coemansia sp. RSA 1813]|nr:hypothetical protein EV178_004491 [Coemansia sp. RSA 1646]KAJ1769428.1 hypothetical protein LPJ74_004034 [Coemansia sp. RSA 1843]KAJ2085557.1 hypothetical protein IW138_006252 [Coemansia sp. RSA 986]KAJ2212922.1 hypothetical protein EV179_004233 [Coemansia sp. RSA 487]KAJ2567597.1 hypothetical protein IW140_004387 [Coemansia sp. RSA 1813]
MPEITRKTKFVDLPDDIQKMLESIERQKQVQIQIGSSIIVDETEKEVKKMAKRVQALAQELEVVKMTLAGDRERVDDAKAHVQFAVKHAEKGASLVAHATDDGSWAQSGLTPLQVANRQKALLALQYPDSAALEAAQNAAGSSNNNSSSDPFEAVRRIQFASMHYDVASEYYWAWLSRVESSAQLLAERLDQLERHVSGSLSRTQLGNSAASAGDEDDPNDQAKAAANAAAAANSADSRMSPKTIADVLQYQNDSFMAIAGKVAAVDEDIRRLSKKLAIK